MAKPGQELAARFRKVVEADELERRRREEEKLRRLEVARAARKELLDHLGEFGEAIGHLQVQAKSHDQGLTLRFRDRFLHFVPVGEADRVKVEFADSDDEEHRLYREPELGDKWVWRFKRQGREDRMLFFDAGLEELCVHALGLPRPDDNAASAPEDVSLDALVPDGKRIL